MKVDFPYGSGTIALELPDTTTVLAPPLVPAAPDATAAIAAALAAPIGTPPLAALVRPNMRVAIAVCDGTRPQPRAAVCGAILDAIGATIPDQDITVLVATGTHRANTAEELEEMFGAEWCRRLSILNHDARDDASLVDLGTMGSDVPVMLNRAWVEADFKITTGFVEPHFFAGYSGGPKLVAPGLAGMRTILALHDARRIGSPSATWGVIEHNTVHDDVRAIAAKTGVDFSCDVVLNRDHEVVAAFSGELFQMHAAARARAEADCRVVAPERYDIVVTSNSGYPLDQNLYQAVKGMSAAARLVKDGGLIVVVAECRDGMPAHGEFTALLQAHDTPAALLAAIDAAATTRPDQWQAQILARLCERTRIALYADGLSAAERTSAFVEPVEDVGALVAAEMARRAPTARCAALIRGPESLVVLAPDA
ncbi:MAG: nickel-dependent lactate racemase [Actinomycetota bacterium]|nr:nickel-dependent lactate racemase [Actinomycetota bacterium]